MEGELRSFLNKTSKFKILNSLSTINPSYIPESEYNNSQNNGQKHMTNTVTTMFHALSFIGYIHL